MEDMMASNGFRTSGLAKRVVGSVFLVLIALPMLAVVASAEEPPPFLLKFGTLGSGGGQFDGPAGVAVDTAGDVYVADEYNHRIQKFGGSGNFLTEWGTYGSGDGQFKYTAGVAVDFAGNVYVVDYYNHRIQKFGSSGNFLSKWGAYGSGDGQFNGTEGVAVDSAGNVYVADCSNHRI